MTLRQQNEKAIRVLLERLCDPGLSAEDCDSLASATAILVEAHDGLPRPELVVAKSKGGGRK